MNDKILHVGFNQDNECFTVSLESGYRIYNTDPLKENCREGDGGIRHVEMLYRCNYVGLVGGGSINPKYLKTKAIIWDDYQKKIAISLDFNGEVLATCLRRDRIAVVFETMIKIFTFSQNPQLLHVFETCSNNEALCSLCSHSINSILAYPSKKLGHAIIIDLAHTEKPPIDISAHDNSLSCLKLSHDGTKLATSSLKGTLIRVFNTENGDLVHELRRGANQANIYCINFNKEATRLCVSSDHGTIHLFNLDNPEKNKQSSLAGASFLPKYFQSKWSSFKFDVHCQSKFICAFSQNQNQHSVIAICMDGTYYKYLLDNINDTKHCELDVSTKFLELTSR